MDQPDIAPLARRLAEENNVDWRRLRGSGDAGRVVERDVLEYLARVMAGDEAVDPTPEPVPDGMQAWPDTDVRAGEAEAARDEVELTSTIEDDIFLFDDVPSDGGDGAEHDGAEHDRAEHDRVEHDRVEHDRVEHDRGEQHRGEQHRVEHDRVEDEIDLDADADADADDDLLWSDTGSVDGEFDLDTRADTSAEDDLEEDLLVAGDDEPEPFVGAWSDAPSATTRAASSASGLPDLFGARPSQQTGGDEPPALFADDHGAGFGVPKAWSAGPELGDESADESAWAADGGMAAVPSIDEPVADAVDDGADDGVPPDLAVSLDDAHLHANERDDVPVGGAEGVAPPVAVPSGYTGQATIGRDVPLLRHRHVWRRQVDLTALVCAQADLAGDLGRDDPVPIGAFLLRAGQKALGPRGGTVALASIDAGDVRRARVSETSDFASTVAALEQTLAAGASDDAGPVDLVVADLSELGIDDAVLQLDAPVVMLGRMLIDNQSGGRRAYLTMSGDGADGADAAQLLARVAELLEAPVRIVL